MGRPHGQGTMSDEWGHWVGAWDDYHNCYGSGTYTSRYHGIVHEGVWSEDYHLDGVNVWDLK
jgi:hypothetical protein